MCLHIKKSFVAEKHIIAYKIGINNNNCILTCFQDSLLPFNKLVTDPNFNEIRHRILLSSENYYNVGCGYFHAFISLKRAKSAEDYLRHCFYYLYDCFLVVIPKGSVGFYGEDNDICANQMIFLNPDTPGFKEICLQYGITDNKYRKLLSL